MSHRDVCRNCNHRYNYIDGCRVCMHCPPPESDEFAPVDYDDDSQWDENGSRSFPGFAINDGGMRLYRCGGSTEERCDNYNCPRCG